MKAPSASLHIPALQWLNRRRVPLGVALAIAAVHLGLFAVLGLVRPVPMQLAQAPVYVTLEGPEPRPIPPPPPVIDPAPKSGGGAPAAPSIVRLPVKPPPRPPEIVAPPEPAPVPPLVIGNAPVATPVPGPGQGGTGTGVGTGSGSGAGPGEGGTRARLTSGPRQADIFRNYPRVAQRARRSGAVRMRCLVRRDGRLDACNVISETPQGQGFGAAALAMRDLFRALPATDGSGPVDDGVLIVGVDFGPQ